MRFTASTGFSVSDIDEMIGPELPAQLQSRLARAREDHRLRAQRLGDRHGQKPDRARSGDDHALSGDQAAERVEGVHRRAGGHDQRRLLVADAVGHMHQGIDVVHGVFGEAAVGGEAVRPVALVVRRRSSCRS